MSNNIQIDYLKKKLTRLPLDYIGPSSLWPSQFEIKSGDYIVKLASTKKEIFDAYKLRYQVFHCELGGKRFPFGFDKDRYDDFSKLLIVKDIRSQRVIGTYRLILSEDVGNFYCNSEFDLSSFHVQSGQKLELSRACIHRDFRNGRVINLLWKGIAAVIQKSECPFVFGMSSVSSVTRVQIRDLVAHMLRQGYFAQDLFVPVLEAFKVRMDIVDACETEIESDIERLMPSLFKSYLKAGAKICSFPAYDDKFKCYDFLTVWDFKNIDTSRMKKFFQ
jgi:putative hemolysin